MRNTFLAAVAAMILAVTMTATPTLAADRYFALPPFDASGEYTIPGDPGTPEWVSFWRDPPEWARDAFPSFGQPEGPDLLLPRDFVNPPDRVWGNVGYGLNEDDGLIPTSRGMWVMDLWDGTWYDQAHWTNPAKTDGMEYYGAQTPSGMLFPWPPNPSTLIRLNLSADDGTGDVWVLITQDSAAHYAYVETVSNREQGWDFQLCEEGLQSGPFACNN